MKMNTKALKVVLPVAIVAAGFVLMVALIKNRPEQKKVQREAPPVLVEVINAASADTNAMVHATATVSAAREVTVVTQVSGVVTRVSEDFVSGGFFRKDQVLFTIDDTDYRLALKSAEAARAKALHNLEAVRSRAGIAQKEWEILKAGSGSGGEKPNPLVLYGPQLREAQAALGSAEASVKLAELNLNRTRLLAPFDARVRSEGIDVGQFVVAGSKVAVLAGTETAEVVVPLQKEDLGWVILPGSVKGAGGSEAHVSLSHDPARYEWIGRVVRSVGEVDPKSRMISVVVEVDDPYGIKNGAKDRRQLLNGSFVNVTIRGRALRGVFSLPRSALREGSTVWLMDEDEMLKIRHVEVLRHEMDRVIIGSGLSEGDRIVLTGISGAADGMRLRAVQAGDTGG